MPGSTPLYAEQITKVGVFWQFRGSAKSMTHAPDPPRLISLWEHGDAWCVNIIYVWRLEFAIYCECMSMGRPMGESNDSL